MSYYTKREWKKKYRSVKREIRKDKSLDRFSKKMELEEAKRFYKLNLDMILQTKGVEKEKTEMKNLE